MLVLSLLPHDVALSASTVLPYLGPETLMPLGSAIAAIVGFLLIVWNLGFSSIRKLLRRGRPTTAEFDQEFNDNAGLDAPGNDSV